MIQISHIKPRFEFLSNFSLLIFNVNGREVMTPSAYILNLISFLDEAERLKAKLLLVIAPSEVYQMNFRMHDWVSRYLFPQMNHLGIKKIAFNVKSLPEDIEEHKATFGQQPEIGVFTSMPEAKAWLLDVLDRSAFALSLELSDNNPVKSNKAS